VFRLVIYNFKISYRARKLNHINISSRRLNYKGVSPLNIKLLLIL